MLLTSGAGLAALPMEPNDIQATFFNGQPFTATALTGAKFKMTFTPDGKMTRESFAQTSKKEYWHVEAQCERLLHELGTREVELLHGRSNQRKQMVGSKARNHYRRLSCSLV
jgi:hypothetical protein